MNYTIWRSQTPWCSISSYCRVKKQNEKEFENDLAFMSGALQMGSNQGKKSCETLPLKYKINPNQICIVPFGTLFLRTVFKH